MAAHFLRDCQHIIEIGGAGLPINRFLTHNPASVYVIDPKIEPYRSDTLNGTPCHIEYIPSKFQTVTLVPEPFQYGLVMLGLSLKPFGSKNALDERLLKWVDEARIVIIDYSIGLDRAAQQFPQLTGRGTLRELVCIRLKIEDTRIGASAFSERQFMVFEPI